MALLLEKAATVTSRESRNEVTVNNAMASSLKRNECPVAPIATS
jgi:hypothetical protein